MTSDILYVEMESDLVPSPVEYSVLIPEGGQDTKDQPLILNLHGGTGNRERLQVQKPMWDRLWAEEKVPPMVVVMPTVTPRCLYMDFKDGTEKWETFLVGPFLQHLRASYPVTADPKRTFLMGVSMGGMGALRMAFRYPEKFGGVAALEPGIEPILSFEAIRQKHRFWRSDDLFEKAYGAPVDKGYWAANNPATMVTGNERSIRESGLQIYIEAGDEDQFWLYEGTEFLHQVLWDHRIKHEYHLVRGADHIGPSMVYRLEESIIFLARIMKPWGPPPEEFKETLTLVEGLKASLDEKDHYNDI